MANEEALFSTLNLFESVGIIYDDYCDANSSKEVIDNGEDDEAE